LRVMVASRPNVNFWPDGSTSPGNYGWIIVCLSSKFLVYDLNYLKCDRYATYLWITCILMK
jgi:hypothetical protein